MKDIKEFVNEVPNKAFYGQKCTLIMKDIITKINESYPCDGGMRGMSQKFEVQLSGHLDEDVKRIMNHLLYTYESYKSDGKGYFDPSQFKREYLYKEIENYMKENK